MDDNMDGGGGGGSSPHVLSYDEALEFESLENDYLGDMSAEERIIYENLSVFQKLDYLRSAHRALGSALEKFPNSTLNGKGDAYRHALFSALTRRTLGTELSKNLLTTHEQKPNQHPLEKQMDLYNNIGRDIPLTVSNLESYIQNLVNSGGLLIISNLGIDGRPTHNSILIQSNN